MISLKDYIIEGIFDDEETILSKVNKSVINDIKAWAKTHIAKKKGRMTSYMSDDGDYILEYIGVEDLEIDFLDIPDIVKIKVNNPQNIYLNNIVDGFMEKFVDSEFNNLYIVNGRAKFVGDMQPYKINLLYLDLDDCPNLSDLSPFKDCDIYDLSISCHQQNKRSIDFNGLNIKNELKFSGYYGHAGKNTHEIIVTGKYNVNDDIRIQFLKVHGLPQKISGCLHDNAGLSWWDNDIKSIGEKLIFGVSKDLFKEVYNIVTSKNFKLPKFNKAQFDIAGTGYVFNNPKELSIAMQAGYMRLVNKYHYENSQMYPEYKSYDLQFKNNIEGEYILKQWLDKNGYKLFNEYDLKPANMNKMLHEQNSRTFHILDKNDKIVASYYPLLSIHDNPPHIISTDKNIIDEIKKYIK
jgi:hypothetical protein